MSFLATGPAVVANARHSGHHFAMASSAEPTHSEHQDLWWIGVSCSLLACFGTVSGMMLQKWSHMQEEKKPESERRPPSRRPKWWASLFMMIIIPAPLDVISFSFAAQSLLAPLAAVTLLLNAVLSPYFLGETLTNVDKIATLLIFVGASLSTTFGDHKSIVYTNDGFYKLYDRSIFVVFQVATVVILALLYAYIQLNLPSLIKWNKDAHSRSGSSSPLTYRPKSKMPFNVRVLPFAYGFLAGLAGAQQTVLTKSASELLTQTIKGHNQLNHPLPWIIAVLAVFFASFQIKYISNGLEHFDAVFYLPIYNAFFIVLNIVAGGIYFNEVKDANLEKILIFLAGVAITLAGVLVLTKRDHRVKREDEYGRVPSKDEDEDREAGINLLTGIEDNEIYYEDGDAVFEEQVSGNGNIQANPYDDNVLSDDDL